MANIERDLKIIREATYGEDVRDSIINGISDINDEVTKNTTLANTIKDKQTSLETQFNTQIRNMSQSNPSTAEVVQARSSDTGISYATLGERLKAERVDGGTNLLRSTALKKNMDYMNLWNVSTAVWHVTDDIVFGRTPHRNRSFRGDINDSTAYYGVHDGIYLHENTTYTMSCWVLFDSDCADDEGVVIQASCKDRNSKYYYNTKPLSARDTTKGKWVRLVHTFTTKDLLPDTLSDFCVQTDLRKFHGYVGDFKLELGSHATDWSPNPQDYTLWDNPIGHVVINTNGVDPSTTIGGVWERYMQGRTPIGVGTATDTNKTSKTIASGQTGGTYTETLTINQIPPHSHEQQISADTGGSYQGRTDYSADAMTMNAYPQGISTKSVGGGLAHNNMMPFLGVYFWRRTA